MIFDGQSGALAAAVLRPGKRPTGAENTMIMHRILTLIRRHFSCMYILVRGDGHFSGPELMQMIDAMPGKMPFAYARGAAVHLHCGKRRQCILI